MVRTVVDLFDVAAPGANANIPGASLTPSVSCLIRVTVVLATASVFNYTVTRGGNTRTFGLNASAALNAADVYTLEFMASTLDVINFQVETDGIIRKLQVAEVQEHP